MTGCETIGLEMIGCETIGLEMIGCETIGPEMIGCEMIGSEMMDCGYAVVPAVKVPVPIPIAFLRASSIFIRMPPWTRSRDRETYFERPFLPDAST